MGNWEQFMTNEEKNEKYNLAHRQISAVLEGEENEVAKMSTICSILRNTFSYYYWVGFYVVDHSKKQEQQGQELVIGPYQGTLGCLRIRFGKGVCGTAAQLQETQVVADVHAIANHIACDSASNSEIVVPVFKNNELHSVFDVDSTELNSFNEIDKKWLEKILGEIFN